MNAFDSRIDPAEQVRSSHEEEHSLTMGEPMQQYAASVDMSEISHHGGRNS
jgi:hypothetical protein